VFTCTVCESDYIKTEEHADRKETRNTIEKKDRETDREKKHSFFLTFFQTRLGKKKVR